MTCCYVQLFSIAAHIYGRMYLLEGWWCSAGCRLMGLLMKASSAASQHTNTNRILTKYDKCILELWTRCFRGSSISHIFRCGPGTGLSRFVVIQGAARLKMKTLSHHVAPCSSSCIIQASRSPEIPDRFWTMFLSSSWSLHFSHKAKSVINSDFDYNRRGFKTSQPLCFFRRVLDWFTVKFH